MDEKVDPLGETVLAPAVRPSTDLEIPGEPTKVGVGPPGPPPRMVPPPPPKRGSRVPMVLAAILCAGVGAAAAFFLLSRRGSDDPPPDAAVAAKTSLDAAVGIDAAAVAVDAAVVVSPPPAKVVAHSPEELLGLEEKAISAADPAVLADLVDDGAFGFSPSAQKAPLGGKALIDEILGGANPSGKAGVQVTHAPAEAWITTSGSVAWLAVLETVSVPQDSGKRVTTTFMTSQVAAKDDRGWRVVAWQWAIPVENSLAAKAVADHTIPPVKRIEWSTDETSTGAAAAFGATLQSWSRFTAALSKSDDLLVIGSAPNERFSNKGKRTARTWLKSAGRLEGGDPYRCKRAGDAAWCETTVNLLFAKGKEPMRLLALMRKDGDAWRIVFAHFSNGQ